MKASLFIIGTELTRGIISDKHTFILSGELSRLGYEVIRSVIVPDDGSIETCLKTALYDSNLILLTGGLGPTSDDMTRSIIAKLAGVKLVKNQKAWDLLCKRVGKAVYGANESQVFIPEGFEMIENTMGTACGFCGCIKSDGKEVMVVSMPGPPVEMQTMFYSSVYPLCAKRIGAVEDNRDEYSVYMIAEAKLEELCKACEVEDVSWGTRFQDYKISLYINGNDKGKRRELKEKLTAMTGPFLVEEGNVDASTLLIDYLLKNKLTISCAESCTGGLVSKLLTDKPGSSSYFWGGVASYDNEAKVRLLGVKRQTLEEFGAVSEQTALEMACGISQVSGTDVSVSLTGLAGPGGGSEEKPVGTICIGLASKFKEPVALTVKVSSLSRDGLRRRFSALALIFVRLYLENVNLVDTVKTWVYI